METKERIDIRNKFGNIDVVPEYPGCDNLAIALCTYFEKHPACPEDDEPSEFEGWSKWVIDQTNKTLENIVEVAIQNASPLSNDLRGSK